MQHALIVGVRVGAWCRSNAGFVVECLESSSRQRVEISTWASFRICCLGS